MPSVTVARVDRWNLRYNDGSRTLTLPVEGSFDGSILSVFLDRVDRWDSPVGWPLTSADKVVLRDRIAAELRQQGVAAEFDPAS